jgi:hypothetical protein
VSSANEGGAGARGIRYDGSAAGARGDGSDVLRDWAVVVGGETETTEDGREGNSCESRSEPPEVFLRVSGGRAWAPIAGEPARRTVGTASTEGLLVVCAAPICNGDGTPAIVDESRSRTISVCAGVTSGHSLSICQSQSRTCIRGRWNHTSEQRLITACTQAALYKTCSTATAEEALEPVRLGLAASDAIPNLCACKPPIPCPKASHRGPNSDTTAWWFLAQANVVGEALQLLTGGLGG